MDGVDEVVMEFLAESGESLDRLDGDLLALEMTGARDRLGSALRTLHTIKGTSASLGFGRLAAAAHAGEALLAHLRDHEQALERAAASALLALGDAIRTVLAAIELTGAEPDVDITELIADLARLTPSGGPTGPADRGGLDQGIRSHQPSRANTVRVETGAVDALTALAAELAGIRDQLLTTVGVTGCAALTTGVHRLDAVTSDLQGAVRRLHHRPVGAAWAGVPRLVRDLAVTLGKQVDVVVSGCDLDVDPSIVEALRDPVVHMVRNAVGHGIEHPAARVAAGKRPRGRVVVRAVPAPGHVVIEVCDDGAGIDAQAVRTRAREAGLLSEAAAARLDDDAVLQLLFIPGFTTAPAVTAVSGRGVGMDVVRTDVERIGGSIKIETRLGIGTTVRSRIPLVFLPDGPEWEPPTTGVDASAESTLPHARSL